MPLDLLQKWWCTYLSSLIHVYVLVLAWNLGVTRHAQNLKSNNCSSELYFENIKSASPGSRAYVSIERWRLPLQVWDNNRKKPSRVLRIEFKHNTADVDISRNSRQQHTQVILWSHKIYNSKWRNTANLQLVLFFRFWVLFWYGSQGTLAFPITSYCVLEFTDRITVSK